MLKEKLTKLKAAFKSDNLWLRINLIVNIVFYLQVVFGFFKKGITSYFALVLYAVWLIVNAMYFIRKKRYFEVLFFACILATVLWWFYRLWQLYLASIA